MNGINLNFCRICGGENIRPFFNLGSQPLANLLIKAKDEKEDFYPLSLVWCQDCNLIQLDYTVDPEKLFSKYVWVTGTSEAAKRFSESFCQELVSRSSRKKGGYVLEIASNDGTFLNPFINNGYRVLGVDPAKNIAELAEKEGIPTKCFFFGRKTAEDLVRESGKADMIFARNVLPHVANTRDFVDGLQLCLEENGVLAIEVHYAKKILEGLQYDSIYHEHLCYFTLKSIEKLLNGFGLFIFDILDSPMSGGALVVYAKKQKTKESSAVETYKLNELKDKINDFETWQNFAKKAFLHREKLLEILKEFLNKGKRVAGYGASARSSTLLNFCGIDSKYISCIADQSPLKHNLFTAGTHIKVESPEEVIKENPEYIFILAWNFAEEIIKNLKNKFGYNGGIIVPLPNNPYAKERI